MESSVGYLQAGIAAYKRGRKQEAGRFIKQAIRLNPQNERAWLWLSGLVESDEQRRECLVRVLAINPNNELAQRGLKKLSAETVEEERPVPHIQPPPTADTAEIDPIPIPQPTTPAPTKPFETRHAEPGPVIETETTQKGGEKQRNRLPRSLVIGLIVIILIGLLIAAASLSGYSLPQLNNLASTSAKTISSEDESAIISAIYENIAANNAENIDRYMATIHTQSRDFDSTREKIETLYQNYDLVATIRGVEIVQYSQTEARVSFILETRKQGGPDFRDNRISGTFILRPENGQWKLFDQIVTKIQYFEYVE